MNTSAPSDCTRIVVAALAGYLAVLAGCIDSDRCRPAQVVDTGRCPEGYLLVPGGTFQMGAYKEFTTTLTQDFCMGRTEVTVAEFRECRELGGCTGEPPLTWMIWGCNYREDSSRDDHPVNCVTFAQAREYCQAQGGDLPTEAQWSRAAQGDDARVYPWGSCDPTCARANFDVNGPGGEDPNGLGCAKAHSPPYTWPVGSAPAGASPYGMLDMAGNLNEYVRGCITSLQHCEGELGCIDPQPTGCDDQLYDLTLGSSFNSWIYGMYLYDRGGVGLVSDYTGGVGIRCVMAPLPQ